VSFDPKIQTLQPWLREYAQYLVDSLREAGYEVVVTSGLRTPAKQLELIRAGRTKATRSLHLLGLAFDLQVTPRSGLLEAGLLWESLGGRWGGRFRIPDEIHFDVGTE